MGAVQDATLRSGSKRIIGDILGLYRGYIGVMLGFYYPKNGESNGRENGT